MAGLINKETKAIKLTLGAIVTRPSLAAHVAQLTRESWSANTLTGHKTGPSLTAWLANHLLREERSEIKLQPLHRLGLRMKTLTPPYARTNAFETFDSASPAI
jgi:hypothetical protein